jgi:hypothetical protein
MVSCIALGLMLIFCLCSPSQFRTVDAEGKGFSKGIPGQEEWRDTGCGYHGSFNQTSSSVEAVKKDNQTGAELASLAVLDDHLPNTHFTPLARPSRTPTTSHLRKVNYTSPEPNRTS